MRGIAPNVTPWLDKTVYRNNSAIFYPLYFRREDVKQRELIRDVLDFNVVRDHIAFQPRAEFLPKIWRRIHQKAFSECANENVRIHSAFCIKHTRLDGHCLAGLAQIVCDLPVEESKTIRPRDAKLRTRRKIEKSALPGWRRLRHYCPDESRLSSCLKKPRRNRVVSLAVAPPVPVNASKGCCELDAAGSSGFDCSVCDSGEAIMGSFAIDS